MGVHTNPYTSPPTTQFSLDQSSYDDQADEDNTRMSNFTSFMNDELNGGNNYPTSQPASGFSDDIIGGVGDMTNSALNWISTLASSVNLGMQGAEASLEPAGQMTGNAILSVPKQFAAGVNDSVVNSVGKPGSYVVYGLAAIAALYLAWKIL